MIIENWQIIFIYLFICLLNTNSYPSTPKHKNTTPTVEMQLLKQRENLVEKQLSTEAIVKSKVSGDRGTVKNKATTETEAKNYSSYTETTAEKSKTVKLIKLQSKIRRQLGKKEGYMPICGIDSYEDEIFGCIELDTTKVDTTTAAAITAQEVQNAKMAYRQGSVSSTHIIWVDGPPDEQKLPDEMELCAGLAKCRLPFGSSTNSSNP